MANPKRSEGIIGKTVLKFKVKTESPKVTILLSNDKSEQYKVGYDAANNQFFSDRRQAGKSDFSQKFASIIHVAPRHSNSEIIELVVYFDVASAELFADKGWTVMTDIFFPNEDFNELSLVVENGTIDLLNGEIYWY